MSTEASAPVPAAVPVRAARRWWWTGDLRAARVLRYAFGVSTAAVVSFALAWPLYFLTPVLLAVFLSLPLPAPGLRQVGVMLGYVLVALGLGLCFTLFLLPYPLVYVPLLGVLLFRIYYLANRGGSLWLVLMSLLAVLMLPLLASTGEQLPSWFAFWFAFSSALSILMYAAAHWLFPDPVEAPRPPAKPRLHGYVPPAANAAFKSTAVILPLAVLFIAANWASQLLVLVMAAIFSLMPDLAKGKEAGLKSLISTLIGGFAALLVYWMIVAVPELHFFAALTLLAMLGFGAAIFSGRPNARYMGSAATTLIVLTSSVMADDAVFSDVFVTRVVLIAAATLYVVVAMRVLERFFPVARTG